MVTGNMGRTQSLYRGCSSIHGPLLTASSSSQSSQHHSVSWAWARVSCPLDDMVLCETHAYHQPATDPSHVMVNFIREAKLEGKTTKDVLHTFLRNKSHLFEFWRAIHTWLSLTPYFWYLWRTLVHMIDHLKRHYKQCYHTGWAGR